MKASEAYQLHLFDKVTPIEVVTIQPTKEIPFDLFKQLWHISYFMELMERLPDGRVLWDEDRGDFYSETGMDVEYEFLQQGICLFPLKLPKALAEQIFI